MKSLRHYWQQLRARWSRGIPLRDTVVLVIAIGVTTPALLLLTVEQQLAQKSQQALIGQSELSLMSIGSVSIAEPMWVVDRNALDAAAGRLLENPQVVAVRIEEHLAAAPVVERLRNGYTLSLELETQAQRLRQRSQPVLRGGEALGKVTLWFDPNFGQGLLRERRSQMLWLVAVQVFASLMFLASGSVAFGQPSKIIPLGGSITTQRSCFLAVDHSELFLDSSDIVPTLVSPNFLLSLKSKASGIANFYFTPEDCRACC